MNIAHLLWIVVLVALVEFGLVVLVGVLGAGLRILLRWLKRNKDKMHIYMQTTIMDAYVQRREQCPELKIKKRSIKDLLGIIEQLDGKFADNLWNTYKSTIATSKLLPVARTWVKARSWRKRDVAARIFVLMPLIEDEPSILKLLQDQAILVQITAARSATQLASDTLLHGVVNAMLAQKKWGRYGFRDAFLIPNPKAFEWVIDQLAKEKDSQRRVMLLRIARQKWQKGYFSLIEGDLQSEDDELRLEAAEILLDYPETDYKTKMLTFFTDHCAQVRVAAVSKMPQIWAQETFELIKKALDDQDWWVRLQATLSLRIFGERGRDELLKLKQSTDPDKAKTASYVLALPN